MGKEDWLKERGFVHHEPMTEYQEREMYLKNVIELCETVEMLEPPKGFPDEISLEELRDFVWCWSEFTG